MRIRPTSRLVLIGDSVTDSERGRSEPELWVETLGRGYVSMVNGLLTARYPDHRIQVVNMGIAGDTVRDLKARWQGDVLDQRPDWLSVCIGINDVWRQFDAQYEGEEPITLDEYGRTLDGLLASARPHLKGLILMTPYVIQPSRTEPMRAAMDLYGEVVRQLAAKHKACLVDVQAVLDRASSHLDHMILAWDRVHPTHCGHMVLACAFLDAVGFDWQGLRGYSAPP